MTPKKNPRNPSVFEKGSGKGTETGPLLALDTSTKTASVALLDPANTTILAQRDAPVRTHGKALVPLIQEALEETGLPAHALTAVACGAGPGSFTGVRVGLATAKGLCLLDDLPLVLIPSLHALAARAAPSRQDASQDEVLVAPCLDARRGEVYVSLLACRPGLELHPLLETQALSPAAAVATLGEAAMKTAAHGQRVALLGTGLPLLEDPLRGSKHQELLQPRHDLPPWPDAGAMARMAAKKLSQGHRDELAAAQPIYLRPSDAEQNINLDLSP